jgi:hypothetical protein
VTGQAGRGPWAHPGRLSCKARTKASPDNKIADLIRSAPGAAQQNIQGPCDPISLSGQ